MVPNLVLTPLIHHIWFQMMSSLLFGSTQGLCDVAPFLPSRSQFLMLTSKSKSGRNDADFDDGMIKWRTTEYLHKMLNNGTDYNSGLGRIWTETKTQILASASDVELVKSYSESCFTLLLWRESFCESGRLTLRGSAYCTPSIPTGTACCLQPYRLRQPQIVLRHGSYRLQAFASFYQYPANACTRLHLAAEQQEAGAMLENGGDLRHAPSGRGENLRLGTSARFLLRGVLSLSEVRLSRARRGFRRVECRAHLNLKASL